MRLSCSEACWNARLSGEWIASLAVPWMYTPPDTACSGMMGGGPLTARSLGLRSLELNPVCDPEHWQHVDWSSLMAHLWHPPRYLATDLGLDDWSRLGRMLDGYST